MMNPREAFKFAFLFRCSEEGLSPEQTAQRIEKAAALKTAFDPLVAASKAVAAGGSAAQSLGLAGLLMSLAAGGTVGYGAAKLQEHDYDPDELKQQELIAAYQHYSDQLRRRNLAHQYARPTVAKGL